MKNFDLPDWLKDIYDTDKPDRRLRRPPSIRHYEPTAQPNYFDPGSNWSPADEEAVEEYRRKYEGRCKHEFVAFGFGRKGFCKYCNADGHTNNAGEVEWA